MTPTDWTLVITTGIGFLLAASSPFWIAGIAVKLKAPRLPRKALFSFTCGVVAYGIGGVVALVFLPFELADSYVIPQIEHNYGPSVFSVGVSYVADSYHWVTLLFVGVVSFWFPSYAMRNIWPKVFGNVA